MQMASWYLAKARPRVGFGTDGLPEIDRLQRRVDAHVAEENLSKVSPELLVNWAT